MTDKKESAKLCGHINKHNWNYKEDLGHSVLEDLACEDVAGHTGPHSAMKFEVSFRNDGRGMEGEKKVYWSDMAGTPADEIEPDIQSLVDMLEKERLANLLRSKS